MKNWLTTLGLFVALAGGCVRTINPVLKDEQVINGDNLISTWVQVGEKKPAVLEVKLGGGAKKYYTADFTDGDGKKIALMVRVGKIGDLTVAEFLLDPSAVPDNDYAKGLLLPLYFPVILHIDDPAHPSSITADALKVDWLKQYVGDHAGELQVLAKDDSVITGSTGEFQKFLLRHIKDDGAFDETKWQRRDQPATQEAPNPVQEEGPK